MTTVLVVDDEPIARLGLKTLLASHPTIRVVGECGTGVEARRAIAELDPDLVFLDVKMPDLDGFGALETTRGSSRPAVVFVTAFEHHARQAFDVDAVDYLLKPFDRERFELALSRAEKRVEQSRTEQARTLSVRDGRGVTVVDLAAVSHLESRGNYVRVHGLRLRLLHREPLSSLATRLEPAGFRRISRSLLVNLSLVRRATALGDGRYALTLADGTLVRTSRRSKGAVERMLGTLG
jgi:two-component system LytT family response regulator